MTPKHKPLVAVLYHSRVNETVLRHFPYYINSGADLLMVGRTNTNCVRPGGDKWVHDDGSFQNIYDTNIGPESGPMGANHIERFLGVLDLFTWDNRFENHTHICITEYDAIFLKPIPEKVLDVRGMLIATPAGFHTPDNWFHSSRFFHTPWMMDRTCAERIMKYGNRMLRAGLIEKGFVDRFLGLLVDLHDIPVWSDATYSANSLDTPAFMAGARKALADGCWHLHGVKTKDQLQDLLAP